MATAKNALKPLKSLRHLGVRKICSVQFVSTTFPANSRNDDVIDHLRPLPIPPPAFENSSRPDPADSPYLSPPYTWKNSADSRFLPLTFPASSHVSGPKTATSSISEAARCSLHRVSQINHQPVHIGTSSEEFPFPVHTRPWVQIMRTGFAHIRPPSHTLPGFIPAPAYKVCTIKDDKTNHM